MNLRDKLKFWIMLSNYVDMIVGPDVSPLSLPDAIADSLSYVKAFGGTEQRNLPDGYIERQFIYMMDGSYLAVKDQSITSDYKIEFDFATTNLSSSLGNYFGARARGVAAGGGFRVTKLSNQGVAMYGFDTTDAYESGANIMAANTRYKYVYENGTCKLSSGGTDILTHTYTVNDTSTITAFGINAYTSNGTTYSASGLGIYCYGLKMWNGQGELVMDLVPAVQKGTVPVVGFYDTVSKTFKTATAGTFAAGGEAVPTPDTPMDIVSNNGVLKVRHQSGLPLGYTLLESATGYSTQSVIDTGVAGNNDKLRIVIKGYKDTNSNYTPLIANYVDESSNVTRIIAGASADRVIFNLNRKAASSDALRNCYISDLHTYELYKTAAGVTTIEVDGVVAGTSSNSQGTENATNIALGNSRVLTAEPSTLASDYWYFYFCKIYDDGVLIRDYVPVKRNSDNVVGVYDLVNNTFDAGQYPSFAPFSAGNAVSDPVEIYADGTVETIEDTIGNTATAEMLLKVGDYQDVQSIIDGVVTRNIGVKVLDGTEDWGIQNGSYPYFKVDFDTDFALSTNTYGGFCSHFQCVNTGATQNNQGISLYKSGNYSRIGLRYTDLIEATSGNIPVLKSWLADQYAAGTPVIVIYSLATPTTESVAGQTLQVTDGDNVLEITQASLSGLELEAKYKKQP